jgi:predicted nucleotidyltransferase
MEIQTGQLYDLLKELSDANVKFVVCGGVACVLQGVERSTYDIDLSVSFDSDNLNKLIDITKKFGLKPRIPEPVENLLDEKKRGDWIEKKGALVYTFVSNSGPLQIDIFLSYPKTYDELKENADIVKIENFEFLVSSIEDLLTAKKLITPLRDKDSIDIKELTNILSEKNKNK